MVEVEDEDFRKMLWALEKADEFFSAVTRAYGLLTDAAGTPLIPLPGKVRDALGRAHRYKVAPDRFPDLGD